MLQAANWGSEPKAAIDVLCCVRSQSENLCRCSVMGAAVRRRNRSFTPCAAQMERERIKSRTKGDFATSAPMAAMNLPRSKQSITKAAQPSVCSEGFPNLGDGSITCHISSEYPQQSTEMRNLERAVREIGMRCSPPCGGLVPAVPTLQQPSCLLRCHWR